ncbi:MAG: class I SAM-dependent methyltransferase [Pirellulales bacterium]|nr:class I SAM-dependent methyltransferase [Pirellulales bacterium]
MELECVEKPAAGEVASTTRLVSARCCICDRDDGEPEAVGEDFEYRTSDDTFLAFRCPTCGLVYLNPRPSIDAIDRIYPANYHAFDFSPEHFGLVYRVRRWLEARRLLRYAKGLGNGARILDVGCGDGFHLRLLRDFGNPTWHLEGVDLDLRAVQAARDAGQTVHAGDLEQLRLAAASYDLVLLVMTIEHLAEPAVVLREVARLLKPGGAVIVVTDDASSPSCRLFRGRYWGGYHFPRHWYLFDRHSLALLARLVGLEPVAIESMMSPVNWTYSFHNLLVDWGAPRWLAKRFSLKAPVMLTAFTALDQLLSWLGYGSLLCARLQRPQLEQ